MKKYPIVIGGFYRSGTSLLRRLLDSHSNIHCPPEIKFFKDFFGDYPNDELRHVRLFSTLPSMGLTETESFAIFGSAFVRSHELAAHKAGKRRWADKNPENVLYLNQWRRLLPQGFLFLHVVRDPLDTLASLEEIGFSKAVPPTFEGKVQLLKRFRDAAFTYASHNKASSFTVCYEDLVSAPEQCITSLCNWLEEPVEKEMLARFTLPERGQGIEDPKAMLSQSVHTRSVGRWRRDLTPENVEIASSILGIHADLTYL